MADTIATLAFALAIGAVGCEVPGLAALKAADVLGKPSASGLSMPLALEPVGLGPLLRRRIATRSTLLDDGLRSAPSLSFLNWVMRRDAAINLADPFHKSRAGPGQMQEAFFAALATSPDQLRQRMAFALSQIFVVSFTGTSTMMPLSSVVIAAR